MSWFEPLYAAPADAGRGRGVRDRRRRGGAHRGPPRHARAVGAPLARRAPALTPAASSSRPEIREESDVGDRRRRRAPSAARSSRSRTRRRIRRSWAREGGSESARHGRRVVRDLAVGESERPPAGGRVDGVAAAIRFEAVSGLVVLPAVGLDRTRWAAKTKSASKAST